MQSTEQAPTSASAYDQAVVMVYLIDSRRLAILKARGHERCDVCGSPFQKGGAYAARPRTGSRHYCMLDAVKQGFDLINADGHS